ncbi:uncharacterized protein LOC104897862 [Beta vulgaris subsp. vulgaris]|uniref:uncharacterized protein LOC104897862 n=1 Tax=Beta vulgaris subsp. vulgaris TaxID=3555 RepID=UPI00053F643E|nr:uncharacterized protein LOC104897862 [Beta vulgaris subsp. vulgaris]XP_048500441.1 uncharacterized protein LOC104897862 [Beta vulgaris subsp. vulgaris]
MVYDIGSKEYLMKHRIAEDWDIWAYKMQAAMDYRIMQGDTRLRTESEKIHFMLRYVPNVEPYRFVHHRYGDLWSEEGNFNREKHTYRNQYLPTIEHFITDLKYCENEWKIREKRGCDSSTSSPSIQGTYHVGESSGASVVDGNSENPGVKRETQTPPRAAKRARYQLFEDEFIPENYYTTSDLRTLTYIFDDEENTRTFIAVIEENQVAPVLDVGNEEEGDPNEDEPAEGDPIEEEPVEVE